MVAYNVQSAVDTKHHLIVAHEVTNSGSDRSQLSTMAKQAKAALKTDKLDVVADRGYFKSEEILACDEAGITVTLLDLSWLHGELEPHYSHTGRPSIDPELMISGARDEVLLTATAQNLRKLARYVSRPPPIPATG